MDDWEVGHTSINYSYLDMYEEKVNQEKRAHDAFQNTEKEEESVSELKKPAFFQKDKILDEANKKLNKSQEQEGDIEPWRLEEYEAYKKMQKELEVDF
jgi:hypothetical protein